MNTRKISLFIAGSLLLSGLYLTSCKKDDKDADVESSENNALAESQYNDVTTLVDQAALSGSVTVGIAGGSTANNTNGSLGAACATLSIDTVSSPRVITIDFGTTNCVCNDGRTRRGKIIATYTGKYRDMGTVIAVTFNNYFVNDNQVSGTKTITNMGLNVAGNLVYNIQVNGQIVKANNGGTITWTSTRQREWIAGANTAILSDDAYSITGTASGTNASGKSYSIVITKALVRKMDCRWFESGTLDVTPEGKLKRTLDYGSTGCDANATVSIAGNTFPIVLR